MLKSYGIIKEISNAMAAAAEQVTQDVLGDYENIDGREEELTSQLRGEVNRRLLERVVERLHGSDVRGCSVRVATLKKRQENKVGADLVGVVEIINGPFTLSKAFLAQAKIASTYTSDRGEVFIRTSNRDILRQAEAMLKLSSDSFLLLYSKEGVVSIPAFQVVLANSNTIDTATYPFHSFGRFMEEFIKCFVGDHRISPRALKATGLEDYASKLRAKAALVLRIDLGEAPKLFD